MATRAGDVITYKSKTRKYQDDAKRTTAAFNDLGTQAGLLGKTVVDTLNIAEDFIPKEKAVEESSLGRDNVLEDYNEGIGLFDVDAADEAALQFADDKTLPGKLADLDDYNALTEDSFIPKGVKVEGKNVELGYGDTSLIDAYKKNPVVEKKIDNPYVLVNHQGISNAASRILSGDTIESGSHGGFNAVPLNSTKWQEQQRAGTLKQKLANKTNTRFSEYYNNPNYIWDDKKGWIEVE
jgi:hypothetical protein